MHSFIHSTGRFQQQRNSLLILMQSIHRALDAFNFVRVSR